MDDYRPEVPHEVWELIFTWLPFNDQVKCRTVCRHWLELVTRLPAFKLKNCLCLEHRSLSLHDVPVTSTDSNLHFRTMRIGDQVDLKYCLDWTVFFSKIGETLTTLDISEAGFSDSSRDCFQTIVENLNLFKVLDQLNVGNLPLWLEVAGLTIPDDSDLYWLMERLLREHGSREITSESVQNFLGNVNTKYSRELVINSFLRRHKEIFLKKVTENISGLNYAKDKLTVAALTVKQVMKEIAETEKSIDLKRRTNTSVRVVSFQVKEGVDHNGFNLKTVEKMLVLIPNVQNFNIDSFDIGDGLLQVLEKHTEKITSLQVIYQKDLQKIKGLNFPNLKHFKIKNSYEEFSIETVDHVVELFPSVTTMRAETSFMPDSHFELITELKLWQSWEHKGVLRELAYFKNLSSLEYFLSTGGTKMCYTKHEPIILSSITKFEFSTCSGTGLGFCTECFDTLLQSMPNLRYLSFATNYQPLVYDKIFKYLPNLEKLQIKDWLKTNTFIPDSEWPEMKRLKVLKLDLGTIAGDKASWDNLGKKLKNLQYFEVNARLSVDLLDMIGKNMPRLQKVGLMSGKVPPRILDSKTVVKNGRKFIVIETVQR